MAKLQEIEELYQDTLKNIASSPEEWKRFLRTASKVYRYNFNDQMLLYAQNPEVEACASIDVWNKNMHCWVNRGAKGIALIERNPKGQKKLKYVFDVSSVHKEKNIGKYPYLWVFGEEQENAVISGLEDEYDITFQNGIFSEGIRQIAEKLAEEDVAENFEYIKEAVKDSFLEDITEDELKKCYRETLAESIVYSVLLRCEISRESEYKFEFSNIHEFNSQSILLLLGNSVATHNERLLMEIGKNVRNYNRKHNISENRLDKLQKEQYNKYNEKFKKGNVSNVNFRGGEKNESGIHSERGLSDSELDIKGTAERTAEKVGDYGDGVYAGEQSSGVFSVGGSWRGQNQTYGDTRKSREDVSQSDRTDEDERRDYRTTEKREPNGVGTTGKQYQTQSRGNRERGSDLSDLETEKIKFTQMTLFPSFEEQSGNIAAAMAERLQDETSAAVLMSEDIVDEILRIQPRTFQNGKAGIYHRYVYQDSQDKIIEYLKNLYHNTGYGMMTGDDKKISVWFDDEGVNIAYGMTAFADTSIFVSYENMEQRIRNMILSGNYCSKDEATVLNKIYINEFANRLSLALNEIKNHYSVEELKEDLLSEDVRKNICSYIEKAEPGDEISIGAVSRAKDKIHEIELFGNDKLYFPHNQTIENHLSEKFISSDTLNKEILQGSGIVNSKIRIYEHFLKNRGTDENIKFLKSEYGSGGRGWLGYNTFHDSKGIRITTGNLMSPFAETIFTWNVIEKRISQLVRRNKYLTEQEMESYTAGKNTSELESGNIVTIEEIQNKEIDILHDLLAQMKMEDIGLSYNDGELTANDGQNKWQGKEFYQFLINEAMRFDENGELSGMDIEADVLTDFKKLVKSKGISVIDNQIKSDYGVEKGFEENNTEEQILTVNFQITDDNLGIGTPWEKYRANVSAIRLLKKLESENRLAIPAEQAVLAKYVGWGGLSEVFDSKKQRWENEYNELKQLLTDEEYNAARSSTLNAHYTEPRIIREMYNTLGKMGFSKGNILEPAMGVGNFFGLIPENMSESRLYGVELDDISGRIAKKLYPNADITVSGFENTSFPGDFFDVAIGNVPFGDYKVNDPEYNKENFLIHDYFFAKSLDKVRPGGVVAFITSKGTLDKKDETVRRYLAQRAELLGAVRLPNIAFKANAGTEVTTDIIFLQKRDGLSHEIPEWVSVSRNPDGILMNDYFISHPEMMVGKMQMISGPFGMESACILNENSIFIERLKKALENIKGKIYFDELKELEESINYIPATSDTVNFTYNITDSLIYYRENSIMKLADIPENHIERVKELIDIRKCTYKLIEYQLNEYNDEDIKKEQQKLNKLYDKFVLKYGRISSKINAKYFEDDAGYPMICSLELFDEDEFIGKADIFSKRTIKRAEKVTSVDTASEALTLSLNEKGKIDLAYMSELSGRQEEELTQELRGIIFKNPLSGQWEPADEYLSGNVRNKLSIAQNFAKTSDEFIPNVEALEKVQPKDLAASEIDIRLGATWIDTDTITDFVREVLKPSEYMLRYEWLKIMYSEYTHEWRVKGKNSDSSNPLVNSTYGTGRVNAYKILEDTLNLKEVQVYDKIENADGSISRKLNQKETTIANQKQEALKEAFQEWVFKDRDRRVSLCKKYNELFNSIRPREYVGENLTFPGMALDMCLRPHQKNAVARQLYGPNTLLAHCVGAGKTFEMTAAAMESKRLGLCRKSLFVVPNHLTGDWGKDFLRLYPSAIILVATEKDFTPQNRKKFCSRIATGDYDAVIIGHSQFEKIPLSIERQAAIIETQIEEISTAIATAKYENGDSFSIKQMEKMKKQLNTKLERLNDNSKKDSVVTFEQLGVDRLFVDESHNYKNLYYYTKMRNVSGLSSTEAAKSSDMYAKCMYLDEITGGKGITFATGTPISNSMAELYTNMKYLQSAKLNELGLSYFDAWASVFGETVTEMELAPEGTGFRLKTRFAKFHNIPELISIFKECADIQTRDMLKLPVPEAEYVDVVLEPTKFQKSKIKELGERAENIRNGNVDPREDNMLKITNDGRFLALDERMINQGIEDNENNKSTACVNSLYQIWKETEEQRSTQLVFCDIATPNKDGRFSIYDDIKEKLLRKGVPENEIAFIHDYNTKKRKSDLFSKVRKGKIRFLFGSTPKMGAGTNVQDKLVSLHHLDVPWRPSDIEQQEGRILRQGNENPKVQIFRYIKKGTFDGYSWQLIEKKQRFISQILTSKTPVRNAEIIDDATLNYAEVKALTMDNPKIKEKMELDVEVEKLKILRTSFFNQKYRLEDEIAVSFPSKIVAIKETISGYESDIKTVEEHVFEDDNFEMKIGETVFQDKKDAGEALLSMMPLTGKSSDYTKIGEYRGFQMSVSYDLINSKYVMKLKGQLSHMFHLSEDALGNITRIDNAINSLPQKLEEAELKLEQVKKEFSDAKIEVKKEFSKEDEYQEKSRRLKELEKELNMDKNPKEQVQELSTDKKLEKISNNVSECSAIVSEMTTKDLKQEIPTNKSKSENEIQEIKASLSEAVISKKINETVTTDTDNQDMNLEKSKTVLEEGDIFLYDNSKWIVRKNDGFMLSADNLNKEAKTPFIQWIGAIETHEYSVIVKKSERSAMDIDEKQDNEIQGNKRTALKQNYLR